ncbi:hypothetical protein OG948_57845 (plasmid) [Embleya sp. NBC_00888]|uniref:hypothetical protein n=1 Tax=Embleya sp. NBC_00888 TaxID=2975960 RepID=UPI002F908CAF|nr:hypothetical protein OG948_57845 [Embleya sp. NBC_00888]
MPVAERVGGGQREPGRGVAHVDAHVGPGGLVLEGLLDVRGPSAPETLRRLIRAIREYHHDRLQDDATILLLQWHGAGS